VRFLTSVVCSVVLAAAGLAHADGAFPDEIQVFFSATNPNRIVLAANFGLLESEDDGKTWYFVCEAQAGASGNINRYQYGPDDTLLGDGPAPYPPVPGTTGLFRSGDLGCTWKSATGCFPHGNVFDAAFDPENPGRVLGLSNSDAGGEATAVFPSTDDGATFGCPVYETANSLTGVEFCQSQPGTAFLTGYHVGDAGSVPFLVEGYDGGASWSAELDHPELAALVATFGTDGGVGDGGDAGPLSNPTIALAAVDPNDCGTVYLRLTLLSTGRDFLAVTHDSGQTAQVVFEAPPGMQITAATVGTDGTAYVGCACPAASASPCPHPGLWVAAPGTTSFQQVASIEARCLGTHGGLLYACGDDFADHFALGVSSDQGHTFTSLLQFVQIAGLAACPDTNIVKTCGSVWCGETGLTGLFGITDAGYPCDGGLGSGLGGSGVPPTKGCGCAGAGDAVAALAFLSLAALWRRKRS